MSSKPKKDAKKSENKNQPRVAAPSAEIQRLEQIAQLMSRHDLAELEWERGGEKIRLRTAAAMSYSSALTYAAPTPQVSERPGSLAAAVSAPAPVEAAPKGKQVVSPFVGTFYRSSKPDADPYVRDGQMVKRGDVLCIIEAMKLMNEIEAEFAGKVVTCLVENGQPVEFGEALFLIEPA